MLRAIFCLVAILLGSVATASERLTVVTEEAYPMNYSQGTEVVGTATDYLRHVLNSNSISHDIKLMPWGRAYKTALEGRNVLIYSIARTPDREDKFHWLFEMKQIQYYLYGLSTRQEELQEANACKENKIAVVYGDVTHDHLTSLGCDNLILAQDYKQLDALLQRKRVDFIASSALGIKYFVERYGHNDTSLYQHKTLDGLSTALYFAMSKNSEAELVSTLKSSFTALTVHPSYIPLKEM